MEVPLADIVDRFSILILKWIHGINVRDDLLVYGKECPIDNLFLDLLKVNAEIWELESDIRMGKEGILGFEEVGRRAIAIRDKNQYRIRIKNKIAMAVNESLEIKVAHASQD